MLLVQKYGGSSLADVEKIKKIAQRVVDKYKEGNNICLVVSAMGKSTNQLVSTAYEISKKPDSREMDMLISVGERVSISMMTMAINDLIPNLAVSFTGSQIGLITDCNHQNARILEIKGDRLKNAIQNGKIPVIAGFQGVSTEKEITTLGRGGSDTTAVAVAAALGADVCEIYSDVTYVYTDDPNLNPNAQKIDSIGYEEMLEMASAGAKVLKDDAVEYARRLGVKIVAGNSFDGKLGTIVTDSSLDKDRIISVVYFDKINYQLSSDISENMLKKCRYLQKTKEGYHIFRETEIIEEINASSLVIVGSGLKNHPLIIQSIADYLPDILAFDISNMRFELFFDKQLKRELVNFIHDKLIYSKV
ncbi:MAG: aspartate kinase [Candidatus Delongbacteria bacterium]|nr:aspartate kinase [Candidatus Delongbacteria bacterium]MBN2835194.1 aspartate kinase [Candidatus Delongbacteria bacterium]